MRRGTFRGSNPRPPQLAVTTRSLPTLGGLRCRCPRGSCGRRSVYEAYSSGRPGSGGGGSHLVPCSWPTGTAPGWAISPSSTTARDAISTVTCVAESRRIQNSPCYEAPGVGRRPRSPGPRGVSCSWNTEAPRHTRAAGGPGARPRGSGGGGLWRRSAIPLGCQAGGLSRLGARRRGPRDDQGKGQGAGTEPVRRAAQHLHPGLEDAEQGMEDGGGEAEDSNGR